MSTKDKVGSNIEAETSKLGATIEMIPEKITDDNVKTIDSFFKAIIYHFKPTLFIL